MRDSGLEGFKTGGILKGGYPETMLNRRYIKNRVIIIGSFCFNSENVFNYPSLNDRRCFLEQKMLSFA